MASSGSFQTSAYSSRCLLFEWWVNSQNISNNTTTIGWQLKGAGGSTTNWYTSGNFKVIILGQQVHFSSTRINLYNGTVVASGTFTITHDNNGYKYFDAYAEAGIYYTAVNVSGSGGWELPSIPRQANITGANDFNSDQNPYMTFNNAGGFPLNARLEFGGTSISRNDISNTGNITFNLTQAERNLLYSKCSSSNTLTVRYVIATKLNGNETWWSIADRTMYVVNSNPSFSASNLSYLDTNATIVGITGNNQHIVRNQSDLRVEFTGATALNYATISKYEVTLNGATQTKTSPSTIDYGKMNVSSNMTLSIKAIDSRGNSTIATKTITVFDWILPTAIITLNRLNNYEDTTYLKVDASISSVNSKNAIQSIKYKYKQTSQSTYSSEVSINNKQQCTLNLNKLYAWDVQVKVTDKFGSVIFDLVLAKGIPIMFIDTKKLSVGINCFPAKENSFELNGKTIFDLIYPVGSIYMSVNPVNPSTIFGGTWVVFATGRTIVGIDTGQTEFNTVEKTGGNKAMQKHKHGMTSYYDDANYNVGTIPADNYRYSLPYDAGTITRIQYTNEEGTGDSGNLQPYVVCHIFKRTA